MRRMVPARTSILRPAIGPDTASKVTSIASASPKIAATGSDELPTSQNHILSNFVPSSAVSGAAGASGTQGGAGIATAGPLLISTIGDEIEIEAGVIEIQLPPTCNDKPAVPLILILVPVMAI